MFEVPDWSKTALFELVPEAAEGCLTSFVVAAVPFVDAGIDGKIGGAASEVERARLFFFFSLVADAFSDLACAKAGLGDSTI
jgi:hypothetical protein